MLVNKDGFVFNDVDSVVHTGKGKKGRNVKIKFCFFSNRAFPVGKKASFNSACPSGGCHDKVSSISRPFCVSLASGMSGILVKPGARLGSTLRDDRSMVIGAYANSCVISARYTKNDAGGDGVGVGPEVLCPGVSRAPGDSPGVSDGAGGGRPLCVASGDASRCAALRRSGPGARAR